MRPSKTNKPDFSPGYWLMKLALEFSNTYESISTRLGSALIAQEKISQFMSLPLNDTHWQIEAARMFSTSLARAQFDAWSIASGEDSVHEGVDGFINQTPDEAGDLCGFFLFKSRGYVNFNTGLYFGFLAVLPASFLLTLKVGQIGRRSTGNMEEQVTGEVLSGNDDESRDGRSTEEEAEGLIVLDFVSGLPTWIAVNLWEKARKLARISYEMVRG